MRDGIERAREDGRDTVILDTAGRLHVDEALMDELAARPQGGEAARTSCSSLDAMTGQEAVNVAEAFQERVAFDGVVMTKLDGDARGGAALSVKAVTGKPIKLVSIGEKLDQLEYFHPDRMASRILGMGDVLTLIERAEAAVEEDEQAELEQRMRQGQFSFDDFLKSYRMLRKMGPLQGVLKMIPGMGKQLRSVDVDEQQMARVEAIILSMTPQERRVPHVIDGSRRQRIASGSGTTRRAGEPAARGAQADGEDDEAARQGQDAALPGHGGPALRPAAPERRPAARRRGRRRRSEEVEARGRRGGEMAVKLRLTRVGSKKNPIYRVVVADSRVAARRQVHRDRRALQPAAGPVD